MNLMVVLLKNESHGCIADICSELHLMVALLTYESHGWIAAI